MAKPKTYICKETFVLFQFDEYGCDTGAVIRIEQGAMFQQTDNDYRLMGGEIRLEGITADEGTWLEISKETLAEYFEEVPMVNLEDVVDIEAQTKANNDAIFLSHEEAVNALKKRNKDCPQPPKEGE